MDTCDWVIVALALLMALQGFSRGFVVGAMSLIGFIGGSILGSRIGPTLLSEGDKSPYAALFGLGGALIFGLLLGAFCEAFARRVRRLLIFPGMKFADGFAGALLTACIGLGIAWIVGAVVVQATDQNLLPKSVVTSIRNSTIIKELNEVLPPSGSILHDLARIDPLPDVAGPITEVPAPNPRVASAPGIGRASRSVVRVLGTACGLGVEGSGWVSRTGYIVTNAHVVAGETNTVVQPDGRGPAYHAHVILFDPHNDVAVLSVPALRLPELSLAASADTGQSAAILGYPLDGPFNVEAARLGHAGFLPIQNAYGRPTVRNVMDVRGLVRPGNSGGPLVNPAGQVVGTVFARITNSQKGKPGGYAIPNSVVASELAKAVAHPQRVSTQSCAE